MVDLGFKLHLSLTDKTEMKVFDMAKEHVRRRLAHPQGEEEGYVQTHRRQ